VIEATAARLGAPVYAYGQQWHVWEERGRLIYQDETGLLDLPLPNLLGAHQIQNAGAALTALRLLGMGDAAYEGAVTQVEWPARMQRLSQGALVDLVPDAEVWLDGGHNASAGEALTAHLKTRPARDTYLICGMLNTKDVSGYLSPLAQVATKLYGVSIPGEANTLSADQTVAAALECGLAAEPAASVTDALRTIHATDPNARILICGSLYLAGNVLRENDS
jgi:dihydrofolate synthase/folylpolyglutamate synthase